MPYVATGHPVGPRAEVLQHARRLANVNQRELGALAGIPRSHIRDFEAGSLDVHRHRIRELDAGHAREAAEP
jgi:hypothetical protein